MSSSSTRVWVVTRKRVAPRNSSLAAADADAGRVRCVYETEAHARSIAAQVDDEEVHEGFLELDMTEPPVNPHFTRYVRDPDTGESTLVALNYWDYYRIERRPQYTIYVPSLKMSFCYEYK